MQFRLFCDNVILQQQMDVPVWGWSDPGKKVTVEFAGQKKSAKAGNDGKLVDIVIEKVYK
ncbi:MAG: hypothetical protein K9M75_07220 [Phycisphaerae bacterium]|nr:hypothetical protein [Phycisphaerae bacterium]